MKKLRTTFSQWEGPGLDGLHALFFHSQWDVVDNSLYSLVFQNF